MARICDKCDAPAVDEITFVRTNEKFDLCLSHSEEIKEFISEREKAEKPTRRAGRPPGKGKKKEH